jgi:hypothetical protein
MPQTKYPKHNILYLWALISCICAVIAISFAVFFWIKSTYTPTKTVNYSALREQLKTNNVQGTLVAITSENITIQNNIDQSQQRYRLPGFARILVKKTAKPQDITVGTVLTITLSTKPDNKLVGITILPIQRDGERGRGLGNSSQYTVSAIDGITLTLTSISGSSITQILGEDTVIQSLEYGSVDSLKAGAQVSTSYITKNSTNIIKQITITQ